MTLTADQEHRLEASLIDYQYKVLVAGPRGSVAEQDIIEGQEYTVYPETTLSSSFLPFDTTMTVVSTSAFPSAGGLYIWPHASVTAGQLVKYSGKTSTTFQNVSSLRTSNGFNADLFSTDAKVSTWTEITEKVTSWQFTENLDDVVGTWQLTLSGVDYDNVLLSQNNMVLLLERYSPEPSSLTNWSDWTVFCSGYIMPASIQDDYKRGANWSLSATGLNLYTSRFDMEAKRFGRPNLVENSTATASTYLPDSAAIGHAGEVVGRQTMEPDKAVDGSITTAYCSVVTPALVETEELPFPPLINDGTWLAEIGFGPVGTGEDGAYMVIWSSQNIPMNYFSIGNRQSSYPEVILGSVGIYTKNHTLPTYPAGGRLILCRNREVFEGWAGPQDAEVVEWRKLSLGADFVLRPEGDCVFFMSNHTGIAGYEIKWGDFAGATLPALNYGESYYIPRDGATTIDGRWAVTDTPVPGRNSSASSWAYISVEVPPLAITLDGDITSSSPGVGDALHLSPSTAGLNQSGGSIIIDTEVINYSSATTDTVIVSERGVGITSPASHLDGANVYPYESGQTQYSDRVDYAGWKRKRVLDDAGNPIVPRDFRLLFTNVASPTYPTSTVEYGTWGPDWVTWQIASGHAGSVEWNTPPGGSNRIRHVMLLCYAMSDGGRFLLNEFEVKRSFDYDPSQTRVSTVGEIFQDVLVNDFGLAPGQVSTESISAVAHDFVATKGKMSERLRQLAQEVGAIITYTRDNKIVIAKSPWHPLSALPEVTHTLTRENLRSLSVVESQRNVVSRVVLNARNPQTKETFKIAYPPTAQPLGDELEMERSLLGSINEARWLAEMIYKQENNKNRVDVVLKGHGDGFRLGQRVLLTWDTDRAGRMFNGSNFIIVGISHSVSASSTGEKSCDWGLTLQEFLY